MFEQYDKDHSGSLTRAEIKAALAESGVHISIEELENFHNEKQISSLFFNDYCKHSCEIERIFPKNSGADCPIFI